MNKQLFSLLMLLLGMISVFLFLLIPSNNDPNVTSIYVILLLVTYFISAYYTFQKKGFLHLFSLLQITTFIFVIGILVASPFSPYMDYKVAQSPIYMRFPENTIQKVLLLYSIYISVSSIAYYYFESKFHSQSNYQEVQTLATMETNYFAIGKKVLLFMLPLALLYSFTLFKIGMQNRASLYLAGSNAELGVPIYYRLGNMLFTVGFYFIIASVPPKKDFIKYFLVYMIPTIPTLLMGQRGDFVLPVLFFLWYLSRIYKAKIKITKMVALAAIIIVGSFIIGERRIGNDVGALSVLTVLLGFVSTSSTSFSLMEYYVHFKDKVIDHPYPFFMDPIIGGLTGYYGQSMETLQHRANIGHHLVYTLSPEYYLAGTSTGTSFIAEAYEFGLIGVIIGAVVLAYAINYVDTKMLNSHLRMIFLYVFFTCVVFSPRNSLFVNFYSVLKFGAISFILITIYKLFLPKK